VGTVYEYSRRAAVAVALGGLIVLAGGHSGANAQPETVVVPMNIALVLDGSRAMAGEPNRWMKEAALRFVRHLLLERRVAAKVAVVRYDSGPMELCPLTTVPGRIEVCIKRVGAGGGSRPDLGIAYARRMLAREQATQGYLAQEALIVVLGSRPTRPSPAPLAGRPGRMFSGTPTRASLALQPHVMVVSGGPRADLGGPSTVGVCLRPGCDPRAFRAVVATPMILFQTSAPRQLVPLMERIAHLLPIKVRIAYMPAAYR